MWTHSRTVMPGRPQKFNLTFTAEERKKLENIANSRTCQVRHQQRAKILLLRSSGNSYDAIARTVGVSAPTITKIVKKCFAYGLDAALEDLERTGRPDSISREAKVWIVSLACQIPETVPDAPRTQQWTISQLVAFVRKHCSAKGFPELQGVQRSTVWSILNDRTIKPHRMRYYLVRKDAEFEEKAKNVLLVYKRIEWILQWTRDQVGEGYRVDELCGEAFLSYDEKPGIQAIANIAKDLPATERHGCISRDYEYRRMGTVSVLAGIDLLTGEVIGIVRDQHKSAEFIEFLKKADERYASELTINIILDNHSVHRSKETMEYLATLRQGRFNFIFTPTHASWLNLVECFFSKLTRQALRNLRVKSKEDLVKRIEAWLEETNNEKVVFRWKWNLEDIENAFLPKGKKPPSRGARNGAATLLNT